MVTTISSQWLSSAISTSADVTVPGFSASFQTSANSAQQHHQAIIVLALSWAGPSAHAVLQ